MFGVSRILTGVLTSKVLLLLTSWLVALGAGRAAEAVGDVSSLGQAIAQLTSEYGERYSNGARYAQRLESIRQAIEAGSPASSDAMEVEFAALQREALLAHPALAAHPLLFVVRRQYARDHHNTATFFPKAKTEYNDGAFTGGGALRLLDLRAGGRLTTLRLLDLRAGGV